MTSPTPTLSLRLAGRCLPGILTATLALAVASPGRAADGALAPVANQTDTSRTTSDDEVISLQRFVVTGSNILRLDMEKVAPVTVLNMDAMNARMAFTPVELLTALPQVINLPENETRLGSSGARGDNANINLRNLGSTGTLILVDGLRLPRFSGHRHTR